MSPEVILSNKKHDQKVDIWAAGIILYFACTLKFPFDDSDDSDFVIKEKIIKSDYQELPD